MLIHLAPKKSFIDELLLALVAPQFRWWSGWVTRFEVVVLVWYGMVWYMYWYGMVWYGMVLCIVLLLLLFTLSFSDQLAER